MRLPFGHTDTRPSRISVSCDTFRSGTSFLVLTTTARGVCAAAWTGGTANHANHIVSRITNRRSRALEDKRHLPDHGMLGSPVVALMPVLDLQRR